jgi:hypothetical protein
LIPISFFPEKNHFDVFCFQASHQALVHVRINFAHIKIGVMHFLNDILQLWSFDLVLSDMVLNDVFTGSEHDGIVSIEWRQVPSLATHKC